MRGVGTEPGDFVELDPEQQDADRIARTREAVADVAASLRAELGSFRVEVRHGHVVVLAGGRPRYRATLADDRLVLTPLTPAAGGVL